MHVSEDPEPARVAFPAPLSALSVCWASCRAPRGTRLTVMARLSLGGDLPPESSTGVFPSRLAGAIDGDRGLNARPVRPEPLPG